MKKFGYILCLLALLAGCKNEIPEQPSSMILEAWIDADGYPVVLIHKSYILASAPDTVKTLEELVEGQLIPFGRVTVSDGEHEVVLTGRLDTLYLPPYTYTTTDIEGEVGKTYTVTAGYKDLYATATTTIPPVARLDSLSVSPGPAGVRNIHGYMHVDDPEAYYALFLRKRGTKQYQLCPFGVFSGRDATNGQLDMTIYDPLPKSSDYKGLSYYFQSGDSAIYQLKVARVDEVSYQFWKAYNEQIISRGIFFVSMYKNLPNNVDGGFGNFSGLGSNTYRFSLLNDTIIKF
ncbi:MAG: DUF4249 family protein [Paludibacteraceae bacterium]|nr:DUF4249 family protein [Paludibacteraceae bacterium]